MLNIWLPYDTVLPLLSIYLSEVKTDVHIKILYVSVYNSFVHCKTMEEETPRFPLNNEWINIPYNGLKFSDEVSEVLIQQKYKWILNTSCEVKDARPKWLNFV